MSSSIITTLGNNGIPYAYMSGALLLLLIVMYPNRMVGTKSRKNIHNVTPAYPLIGNFGWIWGIITQRTRLLDEIYRLQKEQGQGGMPITLTFPALGGRVTMINNPAYIQHVQKTNFENYPKGPDQQRIMSDVLGVHGIFASDGAIWSQQRKLAAQIFSVNNFRNHVQSTVIREVQVLDKLLIDASQKGVKVNFPDTMFRFTLNSFAIMAFDADIDCLPTKAEGLDIPNEFATNFDYAQMVMDHRIFALFPKWAEYLTKEGYHMRKALRSLDKYCYSIIDRRLATREKQGGAVADSASDKAGKDLLELFMDKGLNREELLPVILNFLIAGRDTTAQSLAWLFYELWKSPGYIEKIRESIVPVLGSREEQRPLQYDDMKDLPFVHACFYEAVRLWPAVPKNLKRVLKDDIIRPIGEDTIKGLPDLDVRAGESVMWSDWTMSRMPEVWGQDCLEFSPERFLEEGGDDGQLKVKEFSQFKFHSFNAGPRLCLGKTLATYEGMAVMVAILGRYDVEFDDDQMRNNPPTYGDSLTLPCSPYFVHFKERA